MPWVPCRKWKAMLSMTTSRTCRCNFNFVCDACHLALGAAQEKRCPLGSRQQQLHLHSTVWDWGLLIQLAI